jgi:hypothetical protein
MVSHPAEPKDSDAFRIGQGAKVLAKIPADKKKNSALTLFLKAGFQQASVNKRL